MSIITLSTGEPTCTSDDLKTISQAAGFEIGSDDEANFLLFENSFDATCQAVENLPQYEHPHTRPCATENGER